MKNYANGVLLCKDECTAELSLLNLIAAVEERKLTDQTTKRSHFVNAKFLPHSVFLALSDVFDSHITTK